MLETKKKSRITILYEAGVREILWRYYSGRIPLYLLPEYPKSGGSWLCQLLSDYLELPYPRNVLPKFEKSVIHGHMLRRKSFKNAIVMFRDGRDIMVSAYYHYLFKSDRNNHKSVDKLRSQLQFEDYDNIKANLPRFIEHLFTARLHLFHNFNWSEFVDSWIDSGFPVVRYEDMVEDTFGTMLQLLEKDLELEVDKKKLQAVIDKFSFKNVTKRKPGEEDKKSFLRKGIAGDWKNYFTQESCDVFKKVGGQALIRAGYEKDFNWTIHSIK